MSILPTLTSTKIIRALKNAGFIEDRQTGSHLVLYNPTTKARTIVPVHRGKDIKRPLLYDIISDAKLSVEQFLKLL